jgi:hypothetical protein
LLTPWNCRRGPDSNWGAVEELGARLGVMVPRLPSRSTLEQCRALATAIVAKYEVIGDPDVEPYDGQLRAWGGPMSNPQGYYFSWPAERVTTEPTESDS